MRISDWSADVCSSDLGGGYLARQCLGFAYAEQKHWLPAMTAFQQAADEADIARDPTSGQLWAQAGNAALAGEQPDKARTYFNAALARGIPDGLEKGEISLDRRSEERLGGKEWVSRVEIGGAY